MSFVEILRKAVRNPATPWVMFANGTVVFLPGETGDLAAAAARTLAGVGPAQPGTPSADFRVVTLDDGWLVGGHHPDIFTVVAPEEPGDSPSDVVVGLMGRQKRDEDAGTLEVIHVEEGAEPTDDPRLQALLKRDPWPLTEFLLAGDPAIALERVEGGAMVHRETKLPYFLEDPWAEKYFQLANLLGTAVTRDGPRGLEVRVRGALYALMDQELQDYPSGNIMLVSGIDHTGKMKGAAAQAILQKFGQQIEALAQQALAKTDRSLGTVVVTHPPGNDRPHLVHVVSTPKHTPQSPGWLEKAMPGVLDLSLELDCCDIAVVALGTAGGIPPETAARLMLATCQQWFKDHPVARRILFSLPDARVRQAFQAEFRKQKVYCT